MKIAKVTLRIETDFGDVVEFVANDPSPMGDNPALMNRQLDASLLALQERGDKWLDIFCRQYRETDERLDQLRARRAAGLEV